jgi:hypothetical protein
MSNDRWREMEDGWREMDKLDPPPGWWKRSEMREGLLGLIVILALVLPGLLWTWLECWLVSLTGGGVCG